MNKPTYAFILLVMMLCSVNAVARAILLGLHNYPRKSETTAGSDVWSTFFNIGFVVWGAILMWGSR